MLNLFNKKIKSTVNLLGNKDYIVNDYTLKNSKIRNEVLFWSNADLEKKSLNKTRHFPPATKEWFNSIYSFNKNNSKSLIVADKLVKDLFFFYFNLGSKYIKRFRKKFTRKFLRRFTIKWKFIPKYILRYSANKTFVSRAEIKHNNEKVIITVFTFNKVRNYLLKKTLKKKKIQKYLWKLFFKLFKKVNRINNLIVKLQSFRLNSLKKNISLKKFFFKDIVFAARKKNNIINTKKLFFSSYFYKNLNLSPLGLGLSSLLSKIYNKKIELNIVNLKAIYLNSDILSDIVVLKLENNKNKLYFLLNRILDFAKITPLSIVILTKDIVDNASFLKGKKKENILNTIKHKAITGVRLESSGRLTRRKTASRAVFKVRYKGNLKDIRSSFKNERSVMLRGHFKPNLQYTNVNSETRIGSFGLKGWVSSF